MTLKRLRIAMGTWAAIEASAEPAAGRGAASAAGRAGHASRCEAAGTRALVTRAIEAAFAAVAEVERRMHPKRAGSDVERINAAPPGTEIFIHSCTAEVLRFTQRVHARSGGVFDPCLPERPGRLSDLELLDASSQPFEVHPNGGRARQCAPDTRVRWGRENVRVICHAPLLLDLGGIAKGYAIDRAVQALLAAGCNAGLVNIGGDLRVFGERRELLLFRRNDARCEPLGLEDAALAVSDRHADHRPQEHRGYYDRTAITGPVAHAQGHAGAWSRAGARSHSGESGDSSTRCAGAPGYAAVVAPDAMIADALTKCVLLCCEASVPRILREFGATILKQ